MLEKSRSTCYIICITNKFVTRRKTGDKMEIGIIDIDFNSEEAIYMQLCNQIILGIATSQIHDGDVLPSVRQLAEIIGINMHTVNKAYSVLRQEGIVSIDRRKGTVVCIDCDKLCARENLLRDLRKLLARGQCKNITREEAHRMVDEVYDEFLREK